MSHKEINEGGEKLRANETCDEKETKSVSVISDDKGSKWSSFQTVGQRSGGSRLTETEKCVCSSLKDTEMRIRITVFIVSHQITILSVPIVLVVFLWLMKTHRIIVDFWCKRLILNVEISVRIKVSNVHLRQCRVSGTREEKHLLSGRIYSNRTRSAGRRHSYACLPLEAPPL